METEEEMFTQYAGGLIQTIYDCYENWRMPFHRQL